jgi:signal transduction histidine kinase/CHASE1-domain containing sensor protein
MHRGGPSQKRPFWLFRIGGRTVLAANIGAALSVAFFLVVSHWADEKAFQAFNKTSQLTINKLKIEISSNLRTLKALAAFHDTSASSDRSTFSVFAAAIMKDQRGIQALEWAPRVAHADRARYEQNMRDQGRPDFTFKQMNALGRLGPSPEKPEYFPVYFVEPARNNETAIGFDLGSNKARRDGLEKARDSGEATITERIVLVQEAGEQFGFLLFQPIFNRYTTTVDARRSALLGFMLGVFRMDDLVSSAIGASQNSTETFKIFVFDQSAPLGAQRLYPRSSPYRSRSDIPYALCHDGELPFGRRNWLISACAAEDPVGAPTRSLPWMVLAFGVLATFSASSYVELKNVQNRKTQALLDTLKESQASLENAQRIAHIGNWDWDLVDGSLRWSNEACRILGWEREDAPATIEKFFQTIPEDEREFIENAFVKSAKEGAPCVVDHKVIMLDGAEKSVRERGEAELRPDDGAPIRIYGTVQDFTELRAAEARARDVQKMEAVAQLTGGVAHEFNNIFAVVIGSLEFLQDKFGQNDAILKLIDPPMAATMRGADLTRQLLSYARRQALSPSLVDGDVLKVLIETEVKPVMGVGVRVRENISSGDWLLHADITGLGVALVNIASNARDAMPGGGVLTITLREIGISEEEEERSSGAEDLAVGRYIEISLTDNGVGMSKALAEKAFQPFFTTSGEVVGRGLGLSMVQGFAKQSGGDVSIDSTSGVGTTIRLVLPKADLGA